MDNKETLALLEDIEWMGFDDSGANCPGDVIWCVCPSCQSEKPYEQINMDNTGKGHKNHCQLDKAIKELKAQLTFNFGNACPHCNSPEIQADILNPNGNDTAERECKCIECNSEWTETLKVTGVKNLITPNTD